MMIPVEGHPNLFRDEKTGAIINCDDTAYNAYKKASQIRMNYKNEIENLKNEVGEIKSLIKELINETRRN